MTSNDKYSPNKKELALLKVLENPAFATSSITDICKEAGVSRDFYYNTMRKPEFVAFIQNTALEMVKKELYPLWQAAICHAKAGNYQYWKAIMDAAGQYSEKQKHEHTGKDGGPIQTEVKPDLSKLTTEELMQLAELTRKTVKFE